MRQFIMISSLALLLSCTPERRVSIEIVPLEVVYQNGIFKATYDAFDAYNWKPFIEVQVRGGVVVSATYDDVNPSGEYKTQNRWYSETMKKQVGVSPLEAAHELVDRLVLRNGADVDALAGATITSRRFIELAGAALANAAQGVLDTAILPMDDEYTVEGDRNREGYIPRLVLQFENGQITRAAFDQIHMNGDSKKDDTDGIVAEPSWKTTIARLESALVDLQDPKLLTQKPGEELLTELVRGLAGRILNKRSGK